MNAKYYIYWNLRYNVWSVRYKGKVIEHCKYLNCYNCNFKVNQKGRLRVLSEKQKNVHAFLVCTHYTTDVIEQEPYKHRVSYNPYKTDHFYIVEPNLTKITTTDCAILKDDGYVYI